MEDDYDMTIGRLKAALSCGPTPNNEKTMLQTWLSSLSPGGDDDTIIIKHPK